MSEPDLRDAALVVVGHGTSLNAESGAPVFQHAAELRRRGGFAQVREAFWKQPPQVAQVLGELTARRVFVVPLFISEGYFSEQVIPQALGFWDPGQNRVVRTRQQGEQLQVYCRPVGTHPAMTQVLLARARGVVEQFPFPRAPQPRELTLFVAGHGTGRNENSRAVIDAQVERIRALGLYADVQAVFMEEPPLIGEVYQLAQTRQLVVVPFFISDGLHVQEDIPVLLGAPKPLVEKRRQSGRPAWRNPSEKHDKCVWYACSVGTDPSMVEVIVERVREAAAWPVEPKTHKC